MVTTAMAKVRLTLRGPKMADMVEKLVKISTTKLHRAPIILITGIINRWVISEGKRTRNLKSSHVAKSTRAKKSRNNVKKQDTIFHKMQVFGNFT